MKRRLRIHSWPCWALAMVGWLTANNGFGAGRIPPQGIALSDAAWQELSNGVFELSVEIGSIKSAPNTKPKVLARLPDVQIFHKAVDWALRYDEFFDPKQVDEARELLAEGRARAKALRAGKFPWLAASGPVLRGYESKLDGSIQPYAVVIPEDYKVAESPAAPLLVWLAGRNEKRTELAFLMERRSAPGPVAPKGTIVLHPYGRFCNATKFFGEVDVFEAMNQVQSDYHFDTNRIVVGGFSMGGGSAWHLGAHYSGLWCAAFPGAGFAETPEFTHAFAPGSDLPTWWEQTLWRLYDVTGYAGNFYNCPAVAYSGEIDPQKQAADIMETSMAAEGLKLERFIGPQTAHKYHPDTLKDMTARLEALSQAGRPELPPEVRLTTYTLRYPDAAWVRIEALEIHWQRADVQARITKPGQVVIGTTNVTELSLKLAPPLSVTIDGVKVKFDARKDSVGIFLTKRKGKWQAGEWSPELAKRPGLCGPVDDAFMEPFLFVRPTGKPWNDQVGAWARSEMTNAIAMWRQIARGELVVRDDVRVGHEDVAGRNLIIWGDPGSNYFLKTILERLPIQWTKEEITFRGKKYEAEDTAPIMIFPNPLNPKRYVVLNSGLDFRQDAYGSNAKHTPKLPDWAIVDLKTPPGPRWPGLIVDAGFFDEQWR